MFISAAHAAGEAAPQGGGMQLFIMLGVFAVIFYFMIYRPQAKRVQRGGGQTCSRQRREGRPGHLPLVRPR